jgi:hypothetical protein
MFHWEKVQPEKASVEGPAREGLPTKARPEKVHRRRPSRRRSTDEVPAREGFPMKAGRRRFVTKAWSEKVH